jgi:acetyl-CoA/propionyl-CoA carboxylase, biotin carboxylase, biotin carboxyl carrier protein
LPTLALKRRPPTPRRPPRRGDRASSSNNNGRGGATLISPLQGTVFKVAVEQGATVKEGALICVIDAMKMENEITAHKSGVVTELKAIVGAAVQTGDVLAVITSHGESPA